MSSCLFCQLVSGDIPANKVYEDDHVLAFHDIRPQAPVHILIIPKRHIESAQAVKPEDRETLGYLHSVIPVIAEDAGVAEDGYRLVANIGRHGQQTVPHLHYHLLGGRQLGWPPG